MTNARNYISELIVNITTNLQEGNKEAADACFDTLIGAETMWYYLNDCDNSFNDVVFMVLCELEEYFEEN